MSKIEDVIRSFGGHQYKICYRDLCCVIAVEMDYQPNPRSLWSKPVEEAVITLRVLCGGLLPAPLKICGRTEIWMRS